MTLLDALLEDPAGKAVVFSQGLGTHELIVRRLGCGAGKRDWGHVLFNGMVPGEQRGALVERFHNDPACRLFLSTDAGGVGLNLQHAAAVVVNMDLPWNRPGIGGFDRFDSGGAFPRATSLIATR